MVNSSSFDSDEHGDRNAKSSFIQSNNPTASSQSSSPVTASSASLCKTDFSQTADSDLPSVVAHAIEPTPTKTEFNCTMPVENYTTQFCMVVDNSCNNDDNNIGDGVLERDSRLNVEAEEITQSDDSEKTSLCCSLPLEKVQGVLTTYHLPPPPPPPNDKLTTKIEEDDCVKTTKQIARKLLCLYCDRTFVSANLRQKHVERCHSVKQNRRVSSRRQNSLTVTPCVYCSNLNSSEHTLKDLFHHLITEHSNKYFGCFPCGDRFLTSSLLADHNASLHQSLPLESPAISKSPKTNIIKEMETSETESSSVQTNEDDNNGIPVKITRSRMKIKGENSNDIPIIKKSIGSLKKNKLREMHNKKLSIKTSRIALKRSKRLQTKLLESQKTSKRTKKHNTLNNKTDTIISTKSVEKSKNPTITTINPYPEFDSFYRVKKITDHSIDNLKISSLTFDDVFDKAFFNRIKCNIQENLLHHIDGKLFKNEESESRISNFEKISSITQEIQNPSTENYGCELSLNAVTPVASLSLNSQFGEDFEAQIEYGSKPSKKKYQTRQDEVHYKYFTRRKYQASILEHKENRDLSKLDMWTQLVIKKRQQKLLDDKKTAKEILEYNAGEEYKSKIKREELNRILDRRGPFEDLKEEASKKAALDKLNSSSTDSISEESFSEVREVLNAILDKVFETTEEIPTASDCLQDITTCNTFKLSRDREIPSYLNLRRSSSLPNEGEIDQSDKIALICSSQETENFELPTNTVRGKNEMVELTGEWARCRMYICAACGGKLPNMKMLLDHKSIYHQNVWTQHYEFVGNQSELYRHLSIPSLGKVGEVETTVQCKSWRRSESRVCTKCGKQCNALGELHRHILECGGDWTWMLVRKKCKYKPYGAKSRRKRRGLVKRIHQVQKPDQGQKKTYKKSFDGPRPKPSDADTIQRMLANLPAKRSTRKLISLHDGIYKARKKNSTTTTQSKVKCGKMIYRNKKHLNDKPNSNNGLKNNHTTNRRSLRSLNKVLSSRILDTTSKLLVKRKIHRVTRQSKIDTINSKVEDAVVNENVSETVQEEVETEPPKRSSPRLEKTAELTKEEPKKMSIKKMLTGKINIKTFFPVKKRRGRIPAAAQVNQETSEVKTRGKRRSQEAATEEPEKKTLNNLVRTFTLKKKKVEPQQEPEDPKPSKRRKLTRSFRNVIKRVKRNKKSDDEIEKIVQVDGSPIPDSSASRKLTVSSSNSSSNASCSGEPFLDEGLTDLLDKIVTPSTTLEKNENIVPDHPIVINYSDSKEDPPIPETIFNLESNNEKNLQAKGQLDFDMEIEESKTVLPIPENTVVVIEEKKDECAPIKIETTEAISIDTTMLKSPTTPLTSPKLKGKIRKPTRGLNDCIAMLTSKLQQKPIEDEQPIASISSEPLPKVEVKIPPIYLKKECILRIPSFKHITKEEINSNREDCALDLTTKPQTQQEETQVPVNQSNSIDRIIEAVVGNQIADVVKDTVKPVHKREVSVQTFGGDMLPTKKIYPRNSLDDVIDFVANGGSTKTIDLKSEPQNTQPDFEFLNSYVYHNTVKDFNVSKNIELRKIGSARKSKKDDQLILNPQKFLDNNSFMNLLSPIQLYNLNNAFIGQQPILKNLPMKKVGRRTTAKVEEHLVVPGIPCDCEAGKGLCGTNKDCVVVKKKKGRKPKKVIQKSDEPQLLPEKKVESQETILLETNIDDVMNVKEIPAIPENVSELVNEDEPNLLEHKIVEQPFVSDSEDDVPLAALITVKESENEEIKPEEEEIKPEKEEIQPGNEEMKPGNEESKPENEEIEPGNEESKPENEEIEPGNEEMKPDNAEMKPDNEEIKTGNEEIKPVNEEIKEPEEIKVVVKKKRGRRPRSSIVVESCEAKTEEEGKLLPKIEENISEPPKRSLRKRIPSPSNLTTELDSIDISIEETINKMVETVPEPPKLKKRGRPRKHAIVEPRLEDPVVSQPSNVEVSEITKEGECNEIVGKPISKRGRRKSKAAKKNIENDLFEDFSLVIKKNRRNIVMVDSEQSFDTEESPEANDIDVNHVVNFEDSVEPMDMELDDIPINSTIIETEFTEEEQIKIKQPKSDEELSRKRSAEENPKVEENNESDETDEKLTVTYEVQNSKEENESLEHSNVIKVIKVKRNRKKKSKITMILNDLKISNEYNSNDSTQSSNLDNLDVDQIADKEELVRKRPRTQTKDNLLITNSNLDDNLLNTGEVKENSLIQDDLNRRKINRNAKSKALENIHDEALSELTESERNRVNTEEESEKKIEIEELEETDSNEVKDDDGLRRSSRRSSRKITSYNENELAEPILDVIEKKNQNDDKKKLNADELFDLLKASDDNIYMPKTKNSFLDNLEESSDILCDNNFDDDFDIEKSALDEITPDIKKDIDKIYEFTESSTENAKTDAIVVKKKSKRSKITSESSCNDNSNSNLSPTTDKPNYCDICNKSFIRIENLVKHKRTLTHIQKLSEIEAKQQAEKNATKKELEITENDSEILKNDDLSIGSLLQNSNSKKVELITSSFSVNTNNQSLKLADIINDVLNKPVLEKQQHLSDMMTDNFNEMRRYKSLGERKRFDSENPISNSNESPNYYEQSLSKATLETQISLLQNMIENQTGVNYIDDISLSSTSIRRSPSPSSEMSITSKQDDSIDNSNNLIKPNTSTEDSFLKPSQYEEISDDSANVRNYEDQKLRKTLNRDEELFLECCSLLKSGSEVSSSYSKKSNKNIIGKMDLKQCEEPEWMERKSLCQKPPFDLIEEFSDNSRVLTPLGDSCADDASNSNTISSNWELGRKEEHNFIDKDENKSFTFEEVLHPNLNERDDEKDGKSWKSAITKFGGILAKTIDAVGKTFTNRNLEENTKEETVKEEFEKKSDDMSDGSTCDSRKMLTKGAMKVFEGLKVSIPTEELNLEEVLNCSPRSKKIDLARLKSEQETSPVSDETSSSSPTKTSRNSRKSKPVKNKSQLASKLLFKMNKKKIEHKKKKLHDQEKSHDVYDFEETQDNSDVFVKPDFRSFRITKKLEDDTPDGKQTGESDSDSTTLNSAELHSASSASSQSNTSTTKKPKSEQNITKKKCMIMGRIFKNAVKSKIEEEIRNIPSINNTELVENYVLTCNPQETKEVDDSAATKPKMSEQEMNLLFDKLLSDKLDDKETKQLKNRTSNTEVENNKKKLKMKRKRIRINSESTDDEFNINKTTKKRTNRKNAKIEDNCINLEQELKECIGVASRKSQRKCTSGKQNVLVEYWSSDDSAFEALLESQILEPKISSPIPETSELIPSPQLQIEDIIEAKLCSTSSPITDHQSSEIPKPNRKLQQKKKKITNENSNNNINNNRRKRAAVNPLYHWSSSSEDESQDLIQVKPLRDEIDDEDERPIQHGWIVGDSPKKLVTMLAQAKGSKKVDADCVKEQSRKRTNAFS